MATDDRAATAGEPEPIAVDAIESFLRCPRQYQYDHRQTVRTRTTRDAIERRTALYRDVLTTALDRCDDPDRLRETAMGYLRERLDARTAADAAVAPAHHREYDEAGIRNAIENYLETHGEDHLAGAVAIDETYSYAGDGVTIACPVDCVRTDGTSYEIVRFVTTLSGIVWENPYSDPVADYRDGESFYPRQVGSVLRAYATIHAVAAAHDVDVHSLQFRYHAIAQETVPTGGDDGRTGPEVVAESRDVTEACWDAGEACDEVLAAVADRIADGRWDPTESRWDAIRSRSCRRCKYREMCLDYVNEEVRF